jgi:hypothetical protein
MNTKIYRNYLTVSKKERINIHLMMNIDKDLENNFTEYRDDDENISEKREAYENRQEG